MAITGGTTITCTSPPSSAVSAGPAPLYGTCSMSDAGAHAERPAMRCSTLPTPGEPKVSFCFLARAINSATDFAGTDGLTASSEPCPTIGFVIGVKSRLVSNGSFLWVLGLIANATEMCIRV